MKKDKITVAIYDRETKTILDQVDFSVPDIFNIFDVCDLCNEKTKCQECIVNLLQMEGYFV
jgi:hypothetical protein